MAVNGELVVMSILTKALIFKPKKLKDSWEHKYGFCVKIDAKTALAKINQARSKRENSDHKFKSYFDYVDTNELRRRSEKQLYEIESSCNNYIELICVVGGLGILILFTSLIPLIWTDPDVKNVRLFLILLSSFVILITGYYSKITIDKRYVDHFLDIENELYKREYGKNLY